MDDVCATMHAVGEGADATLLEVKEHTNFVTKYYYTVRVSINIKLERSRLKYCK
jgi:hypothetical protein